MGIAFLYPGQGAQYIGMGKELYDNFDIVKSVFDKADVILGENLSGLIFGGTEEDIKKTENTQPGILTVSTTVSELLKQKGIVPDMVAGLSLGEYSALVSASAISFEDALPLVRKRGQYMNEAVPAGKGAMAAIIALDADKLQECCNNASDAGIVVIANYNCPGQLVISGELQAVEKACDLAKAAGAKRAIMLQVSGPFHSPLLISAGDKLAAELEKIEFRSPRIPVISNVEARPVDNPDEIKDLLKMQVSHSVRWEESIRYMLANGIDTFVEMGPGKALSGFVKKIDKDARVFNVEDIATLEAALAGLE